MTTTDWLVIVGGAATIAWINWYFFVAGRGGDGANPQARSHDHGHH